MPDKVSETITPSVTFSYSVISKRSSIIFFSGICANFFNWILSKLVQ